MTLLIAVAVTAIVVGTAASFLATRVTRSTLARAIGGRYGTDPIAEHRRTLSRAEDHGSEIEARSKLLELSLEALTSGVVISDHKGNVIAQNRLARDASNRAHERTLVEATTAELMVAAVEGQSVEREIEISGPPARILRVHAVPIIAHGRPIGALTVVDDVTDNHRIEKTRRDFVANLGHELRTPVGALSLLAEMFADEGDPATRANLAERVIIETDRMAHTIDDLLELSRVESEKQPYDEPVNVQLLLDEAVARTKVTADARRVTVGAVAPAEPMEIRGNNDQLVSALVNLVENAVKYSDEGDSVSLRARVVEDDLQIVVEDTGRGIPARDLDRVFERFYRVDRSRDSATGGTGIGLSIVRHVAINHGGSVRVDSFEGDGSTFTIELPCVPAGEQPRIEPAGEMA